MKYSGTLPASSSLTDWSRAPASALEHIARAGSTGGGRGMHY